MEEGRHSSYLSWFSALCALLAIFGTVMLACGLREASTGRIATIVVLYIAAVLIAIVSWRRRRP